MWMSLCLIHDTCNEIMIKKTFRLRWKLTKWLNLWNAYKNESNFTNVCEKGKQQQQPYQKRMYRKKIDRNIAKKSDEYIQTLSIAKSSDVARAHSRMSIQKPSVNVMVLTWIILYKQKKVQRKSPSSHIRVRAIFCFVLLTFVFFAYLHEMQTSPWAIP